ncbi:hypothetical protein D1227_04880 [Henriciella mobilis]|uniref:hypothetical protein n=1 Tax=Henriciella mobilis TaxID=2305467 RepID=UPI000E66E3E2|nr:hypothetical protein [Henriciella mobilis]RIJ17356.1 hypothetical protein D1231_03665 [Henriciella mobilis]RIJ25655.1 hypothetical protein D1227_04880 [Henriciella mobilis]
MRIFNPADPGSGATRLEVENAASGFLLQAYGSTAPGSLASSGAIVSNAGIGGLTLGSSVAGVSLWAANSFDSPQLIIEAEQMKSGAPFVFAGYDAAHLPSSPQAGSLVYFADAGEVAVFDGAQWRQLSDGTAL